MEMIRLALSLIVILITTVGAALICYQFSKERKDLLDNDFSDQFDGEEEDDDES